jgi:precorrin-4 methylase
MRPGEGVAAFAPAGVTMAVFLSGARPDELQAELLAGYPPSTPAAVVKRVSWPDEQVIRTTVGQVADAIRATDASRTVLVLVGDVLADAPVPARSHLYAPEHTTTFRLRSAPGSTAGRPSRVEERS